MAKHLPRIQGRPRFSPWIGKIPWRRRRQPTLVFLPGKSHGQRTLVGYSPWGCTDLGTTEQLHVLENIILSEKKDRERQLPYDFTPFWIQTWNVKSKHTVQWLLEWECWEDGRMGKEGQLHGD